MAATKKAQAPAKKKVEPDSVSRFTVEGKPYEIDMESARPTKQPASAGSQS